MCVWQWLRNVNLLPLVLLLFLLLSPFCGRLRHCERRALTAATALRLMAMTPLTRVHWRRTSTARLTTWTACSSATAWVALLLYHFSNCTFFFSSSSSSHLPPLHPFLSAPPIPFSSSSSTTSSSVFLFLLHLSRPPPPAAPPLWGTSRLWTRRSSGTLRAQNLTSAPPSPPALRRNTKKLTRSLIKWCRTIGCQWVPPPTAPPPTSPPAGQGVFWLLTELHLPSAGFHSHFIPPPQPPPAPTPPPKSTGFTLHLTSMQQHWPSKCMATPCGTMYRRLCSLGDSVSREDSFLPGWWIWGDGLMRWEGLPLESCQEKYLQRDVLQASACIAWRQSRPLALTLTS